MEKEQLERELKAFAARWKASNYATPMQMVHAEAMKEIKKEKNHEPNTSPNRRP